jgi:hypothetical protein
MMLTLSNRETLLYAPCSLHLLSSSMVSTIEFIRFIRSHCSEERRVKRIAKRKVKEKEIAFGNNIRNLHRLPYIVFLKNINIVHRLSCVDHPVHTWKEKRERIGKAFGRSKHSVVQSIRSFKAFGRSCMTKSNIVSAFLRFLTLLVSFFLEYEPGYFDRFFYFSSRLLFRYFTFCYSFRDKKELERTAKHPVY